MTEIESVHIELCALSDQSDGHESCRLIKFYNINKREDVYLLILTSILANNNKIKSVLLENGFNPRIINKKFNEIFDVISGDSDKRIKLCNKPGFVTVENELYYVKNSGEVLGENGKLKIFPYPNAKTFDISFQPKGTLGEWKDKVAESAKYSSYIMLALCSALAGICIYFTKIESGGFHFCGDSSKGKSTTLDIAASVFWGNPYILDWNITDTAFEQYAESRNHGLFLADELVLIEANKQVAAQKMQKFVYMLGSGLGKLRSNTYQEHLASWQFVALSNGENALSQHASEGQMKRKNGEKARFIDIPVSCNNDMGIFSSLPKGVSSSAEYVERLKVDYSDNYGTAGDGFILKILSKVRKKSSEYITDRLEYYITEFLKKNKVGHNGLERRIATRFALAYASGILGIKTKILPFTETEVFDGVTDCYLKAIDQNPIKKMVFNQKLLDALKKPRKPKKSLVDEDELNNLDVIVLKIKGEYYAAVKSSFFDNNIIGNKKTVIRQLVSEGKLLTDAQGKSTRQCKVNGVKLSRRYCLKVDVVG
ncbi:DUF927 domain-containing protein [Proteus vulgaris]|uniref:DUF927 domain-containing protein n=1 Tax=Proteus vulgaris TaxID=585 RepID=UPI0018C74DAE|nr:DUF927 domain-containing protein [Proteus vulgaris]MBG5986783.1 DUF927 domain-containing protein [Proteus vulgaris]